MRKMALLCFAFGAAMAISSETALARCGMFDVWEGDDVCVKCPGVRAEKIHMCPGGPAGLAVAQGNHPNCAVSLYSAGACGPVKHKKPQQGT